MAEGTINLMAAKSQPASGIVDEEWAELLHGLNNVLVAVLLSAQVMEWKLPSYSRLKRHLHEIERNAQRGGELVKRLLNRIDASPREAPSGCESIGGACGLEAAVIAAAAAETKAVALPERRAPAVDSSATVVRSRSRKKVPHKPV